MLERLQSINRPTLIVVGLGLIVLLALSLGLAWISSGFLHLEGMGSLLAALLLGAAILGGGWWLLKSESPPRWLGGLLISAALLRLAVGIFWFVSLPAWGYDSSPEQAGYVMADAYDRDQTAWELAWSEKPLAKAFQGGYRRVDQYGGLLFLSGLLYRYLGAETHQPLFMVVVTAAFSALAVLFVWAFARHAWDEDTAKLATWILALYPEAVLLGSSQMREAFTISLAIAAFYGLARYWREHTWFGLAWIFGALLLTMPFSPPTTALLMAMLTLQAVVLGKTLFKGHIPRSRRFWLIIGGLTLLVIVGVWLSWGRFAPEGISNPLALVSWWVKKSADWQAYLSERASGWMQKIFDNQPQWTHFPMLLAYGVVQPFLPAALIDITGADIWRGIAIWRALGWIVLLPLLLYAPLQAWGKRGDGFSRGLSLIVWLGILIASYRGGGDMWDNPRYRVTFVGLQAALAAWVWAEQRRASDPNLRRVLMGVALVLLWFIPWYLGRYIHLPWPVGDPFKVLGLGIATAVLYWVWDWASVRREK